MNRIFIPRTLSHLFTTDKGRKVLIEISKAVLTGSVSGAISAAYNYARQELPETKIAIEDFTRPNSTAVNFSAIIEILKQKRGSIVKGRFPRLPGNFLDDESAKQLIKDFKVSILQNKDLDFGKDESQAVDSDSLNLIDSSTPSAPPWVQRDLGEGYFTLLNKRLDEKDRLQPRSLFILDNMVSHYQNMIQIFEKYYLVRFKDGALKEFYAKQTSIPKRKRTMDEIAGNYAKLVKVPAEFKDLIPLEEIDFVYDLQSKYNRIQVERSKAIGELSDWYKSQLSYIEDTYSSMSEPFTSNPIVTGLVTPVAHWPEDLFEEFMSEIDSLKKDMRIINSTIPSDAPSKLERTYRRRLIEFLKNGRYSRSDFQD